MSDLYQEIILDHAEHPRYQGELPNASLHHHELNASCGDEVTIFVELDEQQQIKKLSWQGQGCAISMASMSMLAEKMNEDGWGWEKIERLKTSDLVALLGLDTISPGRLKCISLGLKAVQNIRLSS